MENSNHLTDPMILFNLFHNEMLRKKEMDIAVTRKVPLQTKKVRFCLYVSQAEHMGLRLQS